MLWRSLLGQETAIRMRLKPDLQLYRWGPCTVLEKEVPAMVERTLRVAAVSVTLLAVAGLAWADIETIRIDRTEPFADGQAFGGVGAYVRQIGVVRGSLDPDDPRNAVIGNLHRAPRNAQGRVESAPRLAGTVLSWEWH